MAVPSHGFRDVAAEAAPYLRPWVPSVSLTKGIERSTRKRMSEVTSDEMPGHPVAVLTGPNLAKEILAGQPAASVVAIDDEVIAAELQRIFSRPSLRVYTNPDVVGCEVGGVVKNVIAIAAGMAEGMGFGDNTRATLITRGLAEMTRLGDGDGRPGIDVRRPGRHGRPHRHLLVDAEPQQHRRLRARPGQAIDEITRGDEHGGRGREELARACSTWPAGTAWRCRSPSRSSRCAITARPRRRRLAALMQRSRKSELD